MMNKQKGMSLVETMVYIFILSLLLLVVANALYSVSKLYRVIQSSRAIESTAELALERITREVRDATSVDTVESTLNVSPGKLVLNTTNDIGTPMIIEFQLVGERVRIKEAGVDIGPLSPSKARITNLVFRRIQADKSVAVRVEMNVESGLEQSYKTKAFYTTVVLRGSYLP
jgi:Tfp pilus assembly protein PilW